MTEKFLMFNLEDESSKKLGEVISNETSRKIINLVAEKEASCSDIARELGLPLNTVGYNIDKLMKAGLIKESKSFWSVKGKKIPVYEVASKHIIISQKKTYPSKLNSILPVIILGLIFTIFILFYNNNVVQQNFAKSEFNYDTGNLESVPTASSEAGGEFIDRDNSIKLATSDWFLIISWIAIVIFVIYSIRKK